MSHILSSAFLTLALLFSTPSLDAASFAAPRLHGSAAGLLDSRRAAPLDSNRSTKKVTRGAMLDTAAIRSRLIYPKSALDSARTGVVMVHFAIDPYSKARVISTTAGESSKVFFGVVEQATGSNVPCAAALINGLPVRDTVLLFIEFALEDKSAEPKGRIRFTYESQVAGAAAQRQYEAASSSATAHAKGSPLDQGPRRNEPSDADLRALEATEGPLPRVGDFVEADVQPTYDENDLVRSLKYPEVARRNGVEGNVVVRALVNRDGRVVLTVVDKSADPVLDECAVNAVRQVRFTPARQKGTPVAIWIQIPITFSLQE